MKAYFRDLVLAVAETLKVKPPEIAAVFSSSSTLVVDGNGETVSFAQNVKPEVSQVVQSNVPTEAQLCINRTYSAPSLSENIPPRINDSHGCFRQEGGWSIGVQAIGTGGSVSMNSSEGNDHISATAPFICEKGALSIASMKPKFQDTAPICIPR